MWKFWHGNHLSTGTKWRQFAGLLVCTGLLCQANVSAAMQPPELVFHTPEHLVPISTRLGTMVMPYYSYALELAGLDHPGMPIQVYLVPETSELVNQLPSWVSGYALGESSTVVLFAQRVHSYPARAIEDLLVHEVAHILNYRAARGREIPRWFDEGIATIAARTWDIEDRARLIWAIGDRDQFSLERVNSFFRGNAPTARRGYSLSAGFIRYLIQEYGPETPARILTLVAQDIPFPVAFQQVVARFPEQAATEFVEGQSLWIRWVPVATSDFSIWIGISVLAFVVLGIRIGQMRARRRREAEEDAEDDDQDTEFDYGELEQPTDSDWDDRWRDR